MDVLESRTPRPNQPDHGLYVWPQNMYIEEHLAMFRKAQASLPLAALARGAINYEAAEAFMESGLHEEVEGLPVIPSEHITTALEIFGRQEYHENCKVLLATGVRGLATTMRLKRYFSRKQISTARNMVQGMSSLLITPIMEWVNSEGYVATKGDNGGLAIKASLYDWQKDGEDYRQNDEYTRWRWKQRCEFVAEHGITHTARRYTGYTDSELYPLPLLMQPPGRGQPPMIQELGWLDDGTFKPAPINDPDARFYP